MRSTFRFLAAFACVAAMPVAASAQAAPAEDQHQHGEPAPAPPPAEGGAAVAHDAHAQAETDRACCECPCCKSMAQMHAGDHAGAPSGQAAPEHQHGEAGPQEH